MTNISRRRFVTTGLAVAAVHLGLPSLPKSRSIRGSSRRMREDFTAREKR